MVQLGHLKATQAGLVEQELCGGATSDQNTKQQVSKELYYSHKGLENQFASDLGTMC